LWAKIRTSSSCGGNRREFFFILILAFDKLVNNRKTWKWKGIHGCHHESPGEQEILDRLALSRSVISVSHLFFFLSNIFSFAPHFPKKTFGGILMPTQPTFDNVRDVEAAKLLGLSVKTLRAWRMHRSGPPYIKAGGAVFYNKGDLADWLEVNKIRATATNK
jgi:hypothetical protein